MLYSFGDVVLIKSNNIFAKAIRWHTHSQYTHAAIIISPKGLLLEAVIPKVRLYSLDKYKKEHSGCVLRLNSKLNIPLDLTDSVLREDAIHWLLLQINKPYDWKGILGLVLNKKCGNKNYFYCSELVYTLYSKLNKTIVRDVPDFFTPAEIYRSLAFDVIEEF